MVDWPIDSNRRIIPRDSPIICSDVRRCALVSHICQIGEDAEAMREPGGNPHRQEVLVVELSAEPFSERWRSTPDVDSNVEDLATRYMHELSLRMIELVMKAANHAAR